MCSSFKILTYPLCHLYLAAIWAVVSIRHNCTKHIQCFGKCSKAFQTNSFTNISSVCTSSSWPFWFQCLTGCFSTWLQFFLLWDQILPSTPDKNQDIVRHICTCEVQL